MNPKPKKHAVKTSVLFAAVLCVLLGEGHACFAQTVTVTLNPCTSPAVNGILLTWGPTPHLQLHHQIFPLLTNFTVTNVDLKTPEYCYAYYFQDCVTISNRAIGTNTIQITNLYLLSAPSAPAALFTSSMLPYAWMDGHDIVITGWGEQGMAYKLMAGATPLTCTNELGYVAGTNGPWHFSQPATNAAQFFQTIVLPEPAG